MNKIDMKELDNKMLLLGFRDNLAGTAMLRIAVEEWEPGMSMTKELYPLISQRIGSTPLRVERCCRHAIDTAFDRGSIDTIRGLFGYSLSPDRGCPTVGEFVARMVRVCSNED